MFFAIFIFHYFNYHYLFDFCEIYTYEIVTGKFGKIRRKKTALMMGLLIISILIVFHGIPYYIGLLAVIGVLCFADRKALLEVDYLLLFTFCAFFVFAGNMARIPGVRDFLVIWFSKIPFYMEY